MLRMMSTCRASVLLDYFGEDADRCGICDTCKSRNEIELSRDEFDLIISEIKTLLEGDSYDASGLTQRAPL
jgi:ATP-dependent DNA helicase RecQ